MMSAVDDDGSFDTAEEMDFEQDFVDAMSYNRAKREETASLESGDHVAGKWEERPLLGAGQSDSDEDVAFDRMVGGKTFTSDQVNGLTYTVEDAVESIGFGWFQAQVIITSGLFSMTDALEMLLLAVLGPVLRCEWLLSNRQVAFITTVVFIGMFSGSAMWGKWSDQHGRKPILMIASTWICYMGILTAFSPNYYWILVLRGLVGTGFGGAVQSFTLMSEYLPSKSRAKILIVQNFSWALGSCFEMLMAYYLIPTLGWRVLVAFSALPMFITMFSIWALPESARYLVAAGRKDEALVILHRAARTNKRPLPQGTLVESKQAARGQLRDLVCSKYGRTTFQLWLMWLGTAFSYYGVVLLSSDPVLHNYPMTCHNQKVVAESAEICHCQLLTIDNYKTMIIATFGEFFAIPFNLATIDSLGRKATLAINFTGAAVFFFLLQICTTTTWMTVLSFGVRGCTAGIFNTIYIYTTEVYPTTLRSLGLGTSSAMARVGAMVTPFIAQVLIKTSLHATLSIYGVLCILCAICALCLPIETKGREMPQTQR